MTSRADADDTFDRNGHRIDVRSRWHVVNGGIWEFGTEPRSLKKRGRKPGTTLMPLYSHPIRPPRAVPEMTAARLELRRRIAERNKEP